MSYRVTAPLVLARDRGGHTHHVYEGGIIEWLSDEQRAHLLSSEMVEDLGDDTADDAEDDTDEENGGAAEVHPPAKSAPQTAWAEYAVGQGWDPAEAASTPRAKLIEALS